MAKEKKTGALYCGNKNSWFSATKSRHEMNLNRKYGNIIGRFYSTLNCLVFESKAVLIGSISFESKKKNEERESESEKKIERINIFKTMATLY